MTEVRFSPTYDIVNTTLYIPKDQMALTLAGSRRFSKEKVLIEFGQQHCNVSRQYATERIAALQDSLRDTLVEHSDKLDEAQELNDALWRCLNCGLKKNINR